MHSEKSQVLGGDNFGDGEAIVDLGQVYVVDRHSGHIVRLLGGGFGGRQRGQFVGVVQWLA